MSWTWLKLWCIAWWHSGREDEDDDEEIAGPESSRTGAGYEETLTPLSAETPLPSTVSRCPSLSAIQSTGAALDKIMTFHEYKKSMRPTDLKTISNDSVRNSIILSDHIGLCQTIQDYLVFPVHVFINVIITRD